MYCLLLQPTSTADVITGAPWCCLQVMLQHESPIACSISLPAAGPADTPASLSAVTLQHHNTFTMVADLANSSQLTAPSTAIENIPQAQHSQAGWTHPPVAAAAHNPAQLPTEHVQELSPGQHLMPTTSLPISAAGFTQLGPALTNSTLQPPTPQGSLKPHSPMDTCPSCDTGSQASGLGRGRGPRAGHPDTTTAVLKARSDAAVLKDLKLGPLLGQGCFGRVYRGGCPACLATSLPDQLLEHIMPEGLPAMAFTL
jgi:hypothetical protein